MSSAAETEVADTHHNGKTACHIRVTLEELGCPQVPTPIKANNNTASCFLKSTIQQKSKVFDMNFHWMINTILLEQFWIYWERSKYNKGDYFTKHHHHHPNHHYIMQPKYLHITSPSSIIASVTSLVKGWISHACLYFSCVTRLRPTVSPSTVHI